MTISEAFNELSEQSSAQTLQRRVPTSIGFDMFITVAGTDRLRALHAVSPTFVPEDELPSFFGLSAAAVPEGNGSRVSLSATNVSLNELFTVVAQDIADAASAASTAQEAATRFIERLHSWQRFFLFYPDSGLSPERQQGLFGELTFLKDFVLPGAGPIVGWAAGDPASRDFNFGPWAVEVKTTATKQPQRIIISSELQLDDRGLSDLFLWHLSVDRAEGQGETLPDLVAKIRSTISPLLRNTLEVRLLEAGYLDEHAGRYLSGYIERSRTLFRISSGFPRIVEDDLMVGVGTVRYSIAVEQCINYQVDGDEIRSRLTS